MHVFYTEHLVDPQGPFGRMFRKLRIQGRMLFFQKMSQKALNRVLTLDCSGGIDLLQSPLKIMDLHNKNISVVKNTEIVEFRPQCQIFRGWTLGKFGKEL